MSKSGLKERSLCGLKSSIVVIMISSQLVLIQKRNRLSVFKNRIVHLFNGLKGPRVCLVGMRVTGLMETTPPWHATIYYLPEAGIIIIFSEHEYFFPGLGDRSLLILWPGVGGSGVKSE